MGLFYWQVHLMQTQKKKQLKDALEIYLQKVSILKKGYKQEKFRLAQLAKSALGTMMVDEITSVDIATYRDARLESLNPKTLKKISPATVRLEMSLLSNFFDIARIEWGICDGNPVKNVRKPKTPPGRDRRLTAREERLIHRYCYAHSNIELLSIVVFAVETAMRQSEILKLRWEDVNLRQRVATLNDTKNGSRRDVPMSLTARDMLMRLGPKSSGQIFSYTSSGIKSTWRFMLQRLGIEDLHFHDLRHEACSRLFEKGTLDMMEIAAISGHKSLGMLKRYTHLKAQKLVRKLEAPKNQCRAAVLNHLVPYPAEVIISTQSVKVRVLDFDDLQVEAPVLEEAIEKAQNKLLKALLMRMRQSKPLPLPDQYLETVPQSCLRMLDPLHDTSYML